VRDRLSPLAALQPNRVYVSGIESFGPWTMLTRREGKMKSRIVGLTLGLFVGAVALMLPADANAVYCGDDPVTGCTWGSHGPAVKYPKQHRKHHHKKTHDHMTRAPKADGKLLLL
jgi:hypothetical protein